MADRGRAQDPSLSTEPPSSYRRGNSGRSSRPAREERTSSGGGGRSVGVSLVLAVLVAGLVVAGWFIANQHQLLLEEQAALAAADDRLKVLEQRLRVTDQVLSDTDEDTKKSLGFWESEIRKLWAISNERNKKWIKANESSLTKQKATLSAIEQSQQNLATDVAKHDQAFAQQQDIIDQLASIELRIQQAINNQRDLVDQANATGSAVKTLRADVLARVSQNEEAVAAFDTYRVQLNQRLAAIERQVGVAQNTSTY